MSEARLRELVATGFLTTTSGIDTAIPQDWVNWMLDVVGFDPRGHFAWDERNGSLPLPLTYEGAMAALANNILVSTGDK